MIAFHYPPIRGSSGVQRTLSFSRYLPENRWIPTILTVNRGAFSLTSDDQLTDIPECVSTHRAFALDAGRHFSIKGWHPKSLSLPDRWSSWYWSGVWLAMRLIRENDFDAIWSTYPIATAHRIAATVARKSKIPWVADFRDGMLDEWFPEDPGRRKWHQVIEAETFRRAEKIIVTTEGTQRLYCDRYGKSGRSKVVCISNGYDEEIFAELESQHFEHRGTDGKIKILHSGILYPKERNPTQFFQALADLKESGEINAEFVEVIFRGSRHESHYLPILEDLKIDDVVKLKKGIGFRDAIREMLSADALLLLQGSICNSQIPAKVYEYIRVGTPLFALTDSMGDTGQLLAEVGYGTVVPLDNTTAIRSGFLDLLKDIRAGERARIDMQIVRSFSRRRQTRNLARALDSALSSADIS